MNYRIIKLTGQLIISTLMLLMFGLFFSAIDIARGSTYHVTSVEEANSIGAPGDTIYIAPGNYTTTLRPKVNGEPGKYLTFLPDNGDVTITGVSKGVNLNGRSYIHIKGLKFIEMNGPWIDMSVANPNHIIIEDCYMHTAYTWSGIYIKGASYVKILNNVMISYCPCTKMCIGSGSGGPHDLISLYTGDHNLIEGNEFYDAIHTSLSLQDQSDGTTSWNIIRNNFFSNLVHSNIGIWGVEYVLIEDNVVVDGGEFYYKNYCSRSSRDVDMDRHKHKGIFVNTQFGIIRNNVAVNNGGGLMIASAISDTQYSWKCNAVENRLYNNTIVKNARGVSHNTTDPAINNILKNNIFHENFEYNIYIYDGSGTPSTNQFINNNIFGSNNRYSTQDTRIDNISVEPEFVSEEVRNYRLLNGSPMIDAGAWLTTTTNQGTNSKLMEVEDARYFMDGWDLIEGDQIQLEGQSTLFRIDSVDYSNNILTLEEEASWGSGIGVSLPYNGSKPDLGYWESSSTPINNYTTDTSCIASYLMIGESFEKDRSGNNAQLEINGDIQRSEGAPSGYDGYSRIFAPGNTLNHTDGLSTDISGLEQSFTWSLWVKFDSDLTNDIFLMGKYTEPSSKQYLVYYDKSKQNFAWLLSGDGENSTVCSGKTSLVVGEWIHLTGIYDAQSDQMQLFTNAVLDSSETNPINHSTGIFNGNSDFVLGDFSPSPSLNGKIDEVTLLSKAISKDEVVGIYLYGINGANGGLDQQIITSVTSVKNNDRINIYPNPVNDIITVCGDPVAQNIGINIFNMNGLQVVKSTIKHFPAEIDTKDLMQGLYIVNVLFEDGSSFVRKIIKQ